MAEAEPVQPPADRSAVDAQAVSHLEFGADLVQRQVGLASKPITQPICKRGQLATPTVALRQGCKPSALPFQLDHVVHELRRHPEVPGRLSMPVPLFDKPNNPAAKFNRMCLAHECPQHLFIQSESQMNRGGNPEI